MNPQYNFFMSKKEIPQRFIISKILFSRAKIDFPERKRSNTYKTKNNKNIKVFKFEKKKHFTINTI